MRRSQHGRNIAASKSLKIKIPNAIWNACEPPTKRVTRSSVRKISSAYTDKEHTVDPQNVIATLRTTDGAVEINKTTPGRIRSKDCKIKLWAFHHGGRNHVVKGETMNSIKLDTPCLQSTCKTCLQWQPHLVRETIPQRASLKQQAALEPSVDIEPISPDIDPRILDGTWRFYQSRRGSVASARRFEQPGTITTPELTPVKQSFAGDCLPPKASGTPHPFSNNSPFAFEWEVSLPVPLLAQTVKSTSVRSKWRATPRQRYTIRLGFFSREGKGKYAQLMKEREKKLRKQIYDQAYRERRKREKKEVLAQAGTMV